jgi:TPP-dependent pyruvate/acetoin dehydrogenase alpha subunit
VARVVERRGRVALDDLVPLRILEQDGTLRGDAPMRDEMTLEALRLMKLSRALDVRATKLQRIGRVGVYGPVHGQEASVVGSAFALDPSRDWIVPAYREQPAMIRQGLPLERVLAGYMGRLDLARIPEGVNLVPRNQAVAAQLPHAAGLAWGLKIRKVHAAVLVYLGDGASSEGDFHESANLAGVMRAPLVMFLQNNGYAISTPTALQTAARTFAARAQGYGFEGRCVDGNDLFAVYQTTREAVERALAGEGPTLIESRTYRMGFHNTTDNPKAYRDDAEVTDAASRDPIARLETYLRKAGCWDDAREAEMDRAIERELDEAVATVSAQQLPDPSAMFKNVYADPPPRVRQQREAFEALRKKPS